MFSLRRVASGVFFGLVGMALLAMAMTARAGDATITWTPPTQNCDGTPISGIQGYELRWGQGRTQLSELPPFEYTVEGLKPGLWWFSMAAVDANGVESQFVSVEKLVTAEELVTTGTTVYTFFRTNGNIVVTPTTHTVPLGVVCDSSQSVNGKYKVGLESVQWTGAKLSAALADCG